MKSSPNSDIQSLWHDSNTFTNIQYDQYRNTREVLKSLQSHHHHRIINDLISQGLVISSILKFASQSTTMLWSIVHQKMPKNIFDFTVKYLNNTLATHKNLCKWSIVQSSACSFCLLSETLHHIVSSSRCTLNTEDILGETIMFLIL